jgi:hypothetical protein
LFGATFTISNRCANAAITLSQQRCIRYGDEILQQFLRRQGLPIGHLPCLSWLQTTAQSPWVVQKAGVLTKIDAVQG